VSTYGVSREAKTTMPETILVADNEPDILRFVEVNLRLEGFSVLLARNGEEALRRAVEERPDLVLLDVMMPGLDGFEVCRKLRANPRTSGVPVMFLTAKALTSDKVDGLAAGADDYVLKPFDPVELVARVRTTLRRSADLVATSPLTGLPGNHRIGEEIALRLARGAPAAVIYADLNDFKAYNDRYGFLRGDGVILLTAEILRSALATYAGDDGFIGHVGGDDFVLVCPPAVAGAVCEAVIRRFDARIRSAYDPADAEAGYLEIKDRQGDTRRFGIMSIALGVATNEHRDFADHRAIVEVATEMKSFLKRRRGGSDFAIDGRRRE
jgi:diguanylate cyclase (GGDEF)-like protein